MDSWPKRRWSLTSADLTPGFGHSEAIGRGVDDDTTTPTRVTGLSGVTSIAGGDRTDRATRPSRTAPHRSGRDAAPVGHADTFSAALARYRSVAPRGPATSFTENAERNVLGGNTVAGTGPVLQPHLDPGKIVSWSDVYR